VIPGLAAIIEDDRGRVLLAQRREELTQGALWEFPGGKIQPGETPEDGLKREIAEELGLEIEVREIFAATNHSYRNRNIFLVAYRAKYLGGQPRLTDHQSVEWVEKEQLLQYPLSPADIPIARKLVTYRQKNSPSH
jgi:8-oxo-dGTP diphosphatase